MVEGARACIGYIAGVLENERKPRCRDVAGGSPRAFSGNVQAGLGQQISDFRSSLSAAVLFFSCERVSVALLSVQFSCQQLCRSTGDAEHRP